MINVKENIRKLQDSLPKGVGLVAVSKFHPVELLREAYDAGQRIFGESRAQELLQKVALYRSFADKQSSSNCALCSNDSQH